ncbi:MAG: S8 family serine peptidase [Candidatus Brocadiia bacterium]
MSRWVDLVEPDTIGEAGEHLTAHGQAVTSALLFGSVDPQGEAPQPYGYVDHIRVVDSASLRPENIDLYDVLGRVQEVLNAGEYEFVNLSIGPELPVDDRDVHAWTAVLDEYLASGAAMAAVAAGNNGAADAESGDTRVLVPSDSVNAVAVGASDKQTSGWARAPYSAVGPGRRPGRVKPDVVCFGGSDGQPFYTVGQDGRPRTTMGTSFASPLLLRTAMGIRVAVGPEVPAVAVKAMLINGAQRDERPIHEVGWGRVDAGLSAFVECAAHEVSILYYGHLRPAEMVRLPIPWPEESPGGYVTLTASMCIACPTCPADAANYTRAGVSPVFVPHSKRWNRNGTRRATKPFFTPAQMYPTEWELRRDAHKWETVMKNQRRFQGRTLNDPYFKFHYMAREGGRRMGRRADTVPYALVVCLRATAMPDLYDRVFARYRTRLAPIRPRIELPVRIT